MQLEIIIYLLFVAGKGLCACIYEGDKINRPITYTEIIPSYQETIKLLQA